MPQGQPLKGFAVIPLTFILGLVFLSIGLFVGSTDQVVCERHADGLVSCRVELLLPGQFPLTIHRAEGVKDVYFISEKERMWSHTADRQERHEFTKDVMKIEGFTTIDYANRNDYGELKAFLASPSEKRLQIRHSVSLLRQSLGGFLAALGILLLLGLVVALGKWGLLGQKPYHSHELAVAQKSIKKDSSLATGIQVAIGLFIMGIMSGGPWMYTILDERAQQKTDDFIAAAAEDNRGTIESFLRGKMNVNGKNSQGDTALLVSAKKGNDELVTLLLQNNADPNIRNFSGQEALMLAAQGGHTNIVEKLLNAGANTDAFDHNGNNALYYAIQKNYADIVTLLLQKQADPNAINWDNAVKAADFAWQCGFDQLVTVLLSLGAQFEQVDAHNGNPIFDGGEAIAEVCHQYLRALYSNERNNVLSLIDNREWKTNFAHSRDWTPFQEVRLVTYDVTGGYYNDSAAVIHLIGDSKDGSRSSWSYRLKKVNDTWKLTDERRNIPRQ